MVAPNRPSGDDVIQELDELRKITHGKKNKQTIPGFGMRHNLKKKTFYIFLITLLENTFGASQLRCYAHREKCI